MASKAEVMAQALRGEGCLGRAADDEPVFVLVGHDLLSDLLVEEWAIRAQAHGCPLSKVKEAQDCARQMRNFPNRKYPD